MQFYAPEFFLFLWAIPVIYLLYWTANQLWLRKIKAFGNPTLVLNKLIPFYRASAKWFQMICIMIAIFFATLALARPQWGEEKKKIQRKGIDIVFLLDTSLSMMAEDIKPNRLLKSKLDIKNLAHQLKGDRVGMIVFAGSSFLQSPLTLDYGAFMLFLDAVRVGHVPDPGTSLSEALRLVIKAFPDEGSKHKAILLFTDGEDHEGGIDEVLKEVQKTGIRVYAVGMGTEKGDPIPLKDENRRNTGFKKDRKGQIVLTKLNAPLLERIAGETGGLYLQATPGEQEIRVILKHMESLDKRQFKEQLITEKEDHYQLFLFLALFFLCLEMTIRKTQKNPTQALAVILAFFIFTGFIKTTRGLNDEGNKLFAEKRYQSAINAYHKAQVKNPEDPVIRYNLATTLYQTKNYQEAAKEYEKAIQLAKDKELLGQAHYNYGNTQYRLGNFEKAIESYKKALEINPADKDAKYNLEFLQNKKSMMDKKNQEQKQQKQNKPDQQPQSNQNQQQQQQEQSQDQNQQNKNQGEQQQNQEQPQNQDEQNKDQQNQEEKDQEEQKPQSDQKKDQEPKPQDQESQEAPPPQNQPEPPESEPKNEEQEPDQKPSPEDQEPQPAEPDEGSQDQQNQASQGQPSQPLQGQMNLENALQILDALKESEKDLQDLRRPPVPAQPRTVEKDW